LGNIYKSYFRTGFEMKRIVSLFFLFSFMSTSGCMTIHPQQNQFQDRVSLIIQEQKIQAETQQQIQNRLMELEKLLQELDKRLPEVAIQRAELIPSNQTEISNSAEPQGIHLTKIIESQEAFLSTLDEVVRDGKENSQKIDGLEKRLTSLEKDLPKSNSQKKEILTEKWRETPEINSQKEITRKAAAKHKNITPDYLYEQALEAFSKQEYPKALTLWTEMTDHFPGHKLASNAYFWKGEVCYQMQDFDNAILNYNKVIEKYAESSKYPAALLKMGLSLFALNKSKEGELRLEELIRKFPDRAEAGRAIMFLDKIEVGMP